MIAAAFALATVTWVLVLGAATLVATQPHAALLAQSSLASSSSISSSLIYGFAAAVYGACSFLCHQLPERSFHVASTQLPVCARCTGIYAGGAICAVTSALVRRVPASPIRVETARLLCLVALAPTLMTLGYEWTFRTPSNWIRFAAGVPLGAAVAFLIVASLRPDRSRELSADC